MNKNKKRLSKLLVPMLAVSGMNVNAMEEANRKHPLSKSMEKNHVLQTQSAIRCQDRLMLDEEEEELLFDNVIIKRFNKPHRFKLPLGAATSEFKLRYELVDDHSGYGSPINIENSSKARFKLIGNAGCRGAALKCRSKRTNQLFAVKINVSPNSLDYLSEKNFYRDAEKFGWSWAPRRHDDFASPDGTYTVVDWIEGKTVADWFHDNYTHYRLPQRILLLCKILARYNDIVNDLSNNNKIINDLHIRNIMIQNPDELLFKDPVLKVIDGGEYRKRNPRQIQRTATDFFVSILNHAFKPGYLKGLHHRYERLRIISGISDDDIIANSRKYPDTYLYLKLQDVLKLVNRRYSEEDFTMTEIVPDEEFTYTPAQRAKVVKSLLDLRKELLPLPRRRIKF